MITFNLHEINLSALAIVRSVPHESDGILGLRRGVSGGRALVVRFGIRGLLKGADPLVGSAIATLEEVALEARLGRVDGHC